MTPPRIAHWLGLACLLGLLAGCGESVCEFPESNQPHCEYNEGRSRTCGRGSRHSLLPDDLKSHREGEQTCASLGYTKKDRGASIGSVVYVRP